MTYSMTLAETANVCRNLTHDVKDPTRKPFMTIIIAALAAMAMIAASAMPAHADRRNNNTLKAIAAIAAIALIAKAVKDKNHAKPKPTPVRSPRVPGVCAIEIGSGRGSVTGYAEHCMRAEGFNYRLPTGCSTSIRIYGRHDTFYPEQCLRDAGFLTREH